MSGDVPSSVTHQPEGPGKSSRNVAARAKSAVSPNTADRSLA